MSYYTCSQRLGQSWAQPLPQYKPAPVAYHCNIYRDAETGRQRWAVLELSTRTWYFPKHYGMRAASALCNRMNRGTK
jgi:hypothetical protein